MRIETIFIERCILALRRALDLLQESDKDDLEYDVYRAAVIKEFEIILEQSGKLMKKILKPYFHTSKEVDKLSYKGIFRYAGQHDLLTVDEVERWLKYRDNRNSTSHDYGFELAEKTLPLLPQFILDVDRVVQVIKEKQEEKDDN